MNGGHVDAPRVISLRIATRDTGGREVLYAHPTRIIAGLRSARGRGYAGVLLCGPEVVLHPDLLPVAQAARSLSLVLAVEMHLSGDLVRSLDALRSVAPVVAVVAPNPEDPFVAMRALRETLARGRLMGVRFDTSGVIRCAAAPMRDDVPIGRPPGFAATFAASCDRCGMRDRCAGLEPSALVRFGARVRPFPQAVSNQADLEPILTLADATLEACPIRLGRVTLPPGAGRRGVVVARDDALAIHAAISDSFPDEAIGSIRDTTGQLYIDTSTKPRLDDFAADLRLLVAARACETCDRRVAAGGDCPGAVVPDAQSPFEAEEDWLCRRLGAFTGTLVDIGAGPVRSLARFFDGVREHRARYVALDPNAHALRGSAATLPEGVYIRAMGEHVPLPDGFADQVSVLRAWNHVVDPRQALREIARILRPGGTLLVVDNEAFGLVRSAAQLAAAHAIPVSDTPFEHFRNARAADVRAFIEGDDARAFDIVEVRPVARGTSNQWSVEARRRGFEITSSRGPRSTNAS